MLLTTAKLRTLVRFERSVRDDSIMGAGNEGWVKVAEVRAEVQDTLPSRGDAVVSGVELGNRPCRIRIRYRSDITSAGRVKIEGRVLQIVKGPAVIDNGRALELVAQEYSTQGGGA